MATTAPAKPLVSRGYANIVIFTLVAIAIGCGLMAYEIWGEFGNMKATKPPTYKVDPLPPKVGAVPVAPAPRPGPAGPGPVGPGPVVPGGM